MTICRERGNIFKQSTSRSFTSEISGLRKQYGMRGWRNWQTRTFEVRVVYPWGFESPPSHQKPVHIVCWFFFLCEGGGSNRAAAFMPQAISPVGCCLACGFQSIGMSIRGVLILYRFLFVRGRGLEQHYLLYKSYYIKESAMNSENSSRFFSYAGSGGRTTKND